MIRDAWLARHPYLLPVAGLHAVVDSAVNEIVVSMPFNPEWKEYLDEFVAGVPLLRSCSGRIDLVPAEVMFSMLVQKLASVRLPDRIGHQISALATELSSAKGPHATALAWLLDNDSFSTEHPGPLQWLGWSVLRRYLSQMVATFADWRDEERWLRNYCPTCGSPPCMAQFVGVEPDRFRRLYCGRCATGWRYRRTQCPFCERDEHRLAGFGIDGSPLRIDYCEACGGYIKTYYGNSSETLLLADWMSLHLDLVARDRGLQRLAASLYQF